MQVTAEKGRAEIHDFEFQVFFLTFKHFGYKALLMSVFEGIYEVSNSVEHFNRHACQNKAELCICFQYIPQY